MILDRGRAAFLRLFTFLLGTRQRRHVAYTALLVVLLVVLAHSALRKGGFWDLRDDHRFNDFMAYYQAANAVVVGDLTEAYRPDEAPSVEREFLLVYSEPIPPYQYPPTLATLIAPLGAMPYRVALALWVLGCLALLAWSFRVLDEMLCPPVTGVDKLFGFLLVYRLLQSDFALTNANTLILVLLVAGFRLERRGFSSWGGVVLALAASIKVTPVLLVPWIVYKKRWRMLRGFFGGVLLWGVLVPGTILGPVALQEAFSEWGDAMLGPVLSTAEDSPEPPGEYVAGQSLRSLAHHLLRETDATAHDDDVVPVNVVDLSKRTVDAVYLGISAAILLAALAVYRLRDRGPMWSGSEMATAIVLLAPLAPLSRKAHFVLLLPAAAFAFALVRTAEGRRRWVLGSVWIAALALIVLTAPDLLGDRLSALLMGFSPMTLASFLLAGILVGDTVRTVVKGRRMVAGAKGPGTES